MMKPLRSHAHWAAVGTLAACVVVGVLASALPARPTIPIAAGGTLNQAGATYQLTRDVSATGTAFTIAADGITLDLGGHTITYGTAPGDNRHAVVSQDHDHLVVKNGTIVQGAGNGSGCHAVSITGGDDVEIRDLTLTVRGPDTRNILGNWGSRHHVYRNHCINNSTVVSNRHQGIAAIDIINHAGGGTSVHDNIIDGSPQFGIRLRAKPAGSSGFSVYNNQVRHNAVVANPYGIAVNNMGDCDVYGNTIVARNGRGIHVESEALAAGWILVHDNHIDVKEGPNPEYKPGWSHGIKLEGAPRARVFNNTVVARAEPDFGHAYALDFTLAAGTNCEVYDNTFTAISTDPNLVAAACHPVASHRDSGLRIHDNVFESNSRLVYWDWDGGDGVYLASNTFRRLPGVVPFRTLYFENGGNPAIDNTFLDTRLEGGAALDDALMKPGSLAISYAVRWYLTVAVRDGNGAPMEGAQVMVNDSAGDTVFTSDTSPAGTVRADLLEYLQTGMPPQRTMRTPHRIRISKAALPARELTVTVDRSKELIVSMGELPLAIEKQVNHLAAAPGTTLTYTLICHNTGTATLTDVEVTDPIPAGTSYVAGSARLDGEIITPDPVADGSLTVRLAALEPGQARKITFSVVVK